MLSILALLPISDDKDCNHIRHYGLRHNYQPAWALSPVGDGL